MSETAKEVRAPEIAALAKGLRAIIRRESGVSLGGVAARVVVITSVLGAPLTFEDISLSKPVNIGPDMEPTHGRDKKGRVVLVGVNYVALLASEIWTKVSEI